MDYDDGVMRFTCRDCGSNKLLVVDNYKTITKFERIDKEALRVYQGRLIEEWERTGELGDDHWVMWDSLAHRSGVEEEIDNWDDIDEDDDLPPKN